jgi:hypothetical protein
MFFQSSKNLLIEYLYENRIYFIHILLIFIISCLAIIVKIIRYYIHLLITNQLPTRIDPLQIQLLNKRHVVTNQYQYSMLLMSIEILFQIYIKICIKCILVYPYSTMMMFSIYFETARSSKSLVRYLINSYPTIDDITVSEFVKKIRPLLIATVIYFLVGLLCIFFVAYIKPDVPLY